MEFSTFHYPILHSYMLTFWLEGGVDMRVVIQLWVKYKERHQHLLEHKSKLQPLGGWQTTVELFFFFTQPLTVQIWVVILISVT